jgi:pyrimidine operon attenuation protein/uracil phosphoribosyltransferase
LLKEKSVLLDAGQMAHVIRRLAVEILERERGASRIVLVGIRTRGVPLAEALAAEIERLEGRKVERGVVDITLYRDDLSTIAAQPVVKGTTLPMPVEGALVVLCDDVLYSGRTVRAAIDHLLDYGRPRAIRLAVLVDRGHRELPIQPDYAGLTVATSDTEIVEVAFPSTDEGREGVRLLERLPAIPSAPAAPSVPSA